MDKSIHDMILYYERRAPIYDQSMGYDRLKVLARYDYLLNAIKAKFTGRKILEIACGPGFWTTTLATVAESLLATDFNPAVLAEAGKKSYPCDKVTFQQADAYDLTNIQGRFDGCFAADWWSHVPVSRIPNFVSAIHARLESGAMVAFVDHLDENWAKRAYARTDSEGNVFQKRTLPDGSTYEVIKNFPSEQQLLKYIGAEGRDFRYMEDPETGRWLFSYVKV